MLVRCADKGLVEMLEESGPPALSAFREDTDPLYGYTAAASGAASPKL